MSLPLITVQVSNAGTDDLVAHIFIDFPMTGFVTATALSTPVLSPITRQFGVQNTLDSPNLIVPVSSNFAVPLPDRFNYTFPAMSVTVLAIDSPNIGSSVKAARRSLGWADLNDFSV